MSDVEQFAEEHDEPLAWLGYDRAKGWFVGTVIA